MDDSLKIKRLNAIFIKAIDSATDSIQSNNIIECLNNENNDVISTDKSLFESCYVNTIGKMKNVAEVRYIYIYTSAIYSSVYGIQ